VAGNSSKRGAKSSQIAARSKPIRKKERKAARRPAAQQLSLDEVPHDLREAWRQPLYDNNEARGEHILDGDLLAKTRLAGLKIAATMAKFYPAARAMLSKAWPLAAREQRLPLASTS